MLDDLHIVFAVVVFFIWIRITKLCKWPNAVGTVRSEHILTEGSVKICQKLFDTSAVDCNSFLISTNKTSTVEG